MDVTSIIAAAVVFLGLGVGLGVLLMRQTAAAARAEGQRVVEGQVATLTEKVRAAAEEKESLRRELAEAEERLGVAQEKHAAVAADAARAWGEVEHGARVKEELQAAQLRLSDAGERLTASESLKASAQTGLESARARLAQVEADLSGLRAEEERRRAELAAVKEERASLTAQVAAQLDAARQRLAQAEEQKAQLKLELETVAGKLVDDKGKLLMETNQKGLETLLSPLKERLKEFEEKVEKAYSQENRDRAALLEKLAQLQEAQVRLSKDADGLTRALTGESKSQGDWGEMVLERLLETAGLTEGREYDLQASHTDEEGGRKRPDAIIYLPADRAVVVDAKCSLTAFVEAMHASDEEEKQACLDAHLVSVQTHVKGLSAKRYQEVLKQRTLDVVLLFIPNEAAFHAAISRRMSLYEESFQQGVVVCSPTTLLAALQLISHVWRTERQNENAQRIAEEAGKMHKALAAFVKDLDAVGQRLGQASQSYESARKRLSTGRGNVIKRARTVEALGARVNEQDKAQLKLIAGGDDGEGDEDDAPMEDGDGGVDESSA